MGTASQAVLHLFDALEKARGLAVARAQVAAAKSKPTDWLKANKAPARSPRRAKSADDSLPWRGWHQWTALLHALEPWPEARQAAAAWVESLDPADT
jgi:hypothetical protein